MTPALRWLEDRAYAAYIVAYLRCVEPDWMLHLRWRAFWLVSTVRRAVRP